MQRGSRATLATLPTGGAGGGGASVAQFAMADTGSVDWLADSGMALFGGSDAASSDPYIWLEAIGGVGTRDGDTAADGQRQSYAGAVGGVRMPLAEDLEVGFALSGFTGNTNTDDDLASTDTTSFMAAAHGHWSPGRWRLDGALGMAFHNFDSDRRVDFGGFLRTAEGDRDGIEVIGDIAARYDWQTDGVTLSPVAGLTVSWLNEDSWQESGAGAANLAFEEVETVSVQPRLGLGISTDIVLDSDLTLTPRAEVLWIGELGDAGSAYTARLAGATPSWRVPGLEEPRHSGAVGLAVDLVSADGWTVTAGYAGRFGDGAQDHGVLIGASLTF